MLTSSAINVLPGSETFGNGHHADVDINLTYDIRGAGKRGISAWTLGKDTIFFITNDGTLWHTDLTRKERLSGQKLDEFQGGHEFQTAYSNGVVLVSQENANNQCLVVVEPLGKNVKAKSFGFTSCKGASLSGTTLKLAEGSYTVTIENGVDGTFKTKN